MTEIEFREKFTGRFKLKPNEIIPKHILENAETIPTESTTLTVEELRWAQKVALFSICYKQTMSGRWCCRHSSNESCERCYCGRCLPFKS